MIRDAVVHAIDGVPGCVLEPRSSTGFQLGTRPTLTGCTFLPATFVTNDIRYKTRKIADRHILASADIDRLFGGVVLHYKHAGVGEIVNE